MTRKHRLGGAFAALLGGAIAAHAQGVPQTLPSLPGPAGAAPAATPAQPALNVPAYPIYQPGLSANSFPFNGTAGMNGDGLGGQQQARTSGIESHSLPGELLEDIRDHAPYNRLGPTPVDQVRILMDGLGLADLFGDSGIRTFGWLEPTYTGASTGSGLQSVQPRLNRFGNEFLMSEIGLVLQKPLAQDQFDVGFMVRYFAGANAAIGQPKGGIGEDNTDPRFNHDFRDLYVSAHLPILTEGGMDVKVGRMNTIIGWNGFLAPYRPFTSSDYQFFYSQDGAFTGLLTCLHVNDQLDVWNGITLGANTFFVTRSNDSYCYLGQVNYWLTDEKKTRLTASTYCGPNAIFAAPGLAGDFVSMVELRVQQNWSERFFQVVQCNMGWDTNTPVGTGQWYGLYTVGIYHLDEQWDLMGRAEWFDDVNGTRTGVNTNYSAVTLGFNWHPTTYFEFRPEIRGDFAGAPAFGNGGVPQNRSLLTGVAAALVKF